MLFGAQFTHIHAQNTLYAQENTKNSIRNTHTTSEHHYVHAWLLMIIIWYAYDYCYTIHTASNRTHVTRMDCVTFAPARLFSRIYFCARARARVLLCCVSLLCAEHTHARTHLPIYSVLVCVSFFGRRRTQTACKFMHMCGGHNHNNNHNQSQ